jgi:hypothetical protein
MLWEDVAMFQVGFGVGDITPDVGMNMPGGFLKNPGKGVRDHRLQAVACVVSDGKQTVALVGIDSLFIGKSTVEACRRNLFKETKIPADNILIGANHTHTGGPIEDCFSGEAEPKYVQRVIDSITSAVRDGYRSLHAAEIGIGTGLAEGIAYNRRFLMRDGREITHPGKPGTKYHDQIVMPAGPTDPEVGVLAVRNPKGKVRGVVVNFACHSTVVGGNLFSPDYVGYLRHHLRSVYGPTTPVCFLLGACGDITQVDNQSTSVDFGPELGDLMGRRLATEAERVIRRMKWLESGPVAAATRTVPCRIREEPDPEREIPPFGLGSDGKDRIYGKIFDAEKKKVAEERAKNPVLACEVQAVRIGPLGIVSNGSEYFVEYQLRIKKASRLPNTWVSTLTNEYIGYVPTPQAFAGGGYEPRTARSSKLAPDSGQRLLEGALRALAEIDGQADAKPD